MYDYRGYLITVSAVFIALAIGLLIGVSYGEDFLIHNQQEAIEMLEQKLILQDEKIDTMKRDLHAWESFREYFWLKFYNISPEGEDRSVDIISDSRSFTDEITNLMEKQGVKYRAVTLDPGFVRNNEDLTAAACEDTPADAASEAGYLLSILYGGENEAEEDEVTLNIPEKAEKGAEFGMWGEWPEGEAGRTILLLNGLETGEDNHIDVPLEKNKSGNLIKELACRLEAEGHTVVIAFAGYGKKHATGGKWEHPQENLNEWGKTVVDHADTFWGQVALLEVIRRGSSGHYGFIPGNMGILPPAGEVEDDG